MTFNLLTTPWLEVRRASGRRDLVRPCDITGDFTADPILALDFPRPDWNAALTEFLIGLCYVALAPEDANDWAQLFQTPPDPARLEQAFLPFVDAFNLDGDGPRAFQDFDPLDGQDIKPLKGLLIDAPGEIASDKNSDLFVKRDAIGPDGQGAFCLGYAAAALIALQTYAPTGGAGHLASLRGGGPLTTLVTPIRKKKTTASLWDRIWANVPDRDEETGPPSADQIFPWLAPTLVWRKDLGNKTVTQDASHLGLAFFSCPRRIRLVFSDAATCSLSNQAGKGAVGFRTLNYGTKYEHWLHPLSPYYDDKSGAKLPVHPNAGPSDYGDWLTWWGFKGKPAQTMVLWKDRRNEVAFLLADADSMAAFGYDMDSMKARQWLDARLPWVPVHDTAREGLKEEIGQLIAAADEAARAVTRSAKIALYGQRQAEGHYRLPDTLPMNALGEPGERMWRDTEAAFRQKLNDVVTLFQPGLAPTIPLKQDWLETLRRNAIRIFDDTVDLDGFTDADPRRLLYARGQLGFAFADHPKAAVRKALNLGVTEKPAKTAKGRN